MKKIFHGDYPVQNHLFYHIHVFSTLKVPRLLNTCCYAYPRSHQCQNLVAYLTPSWEEEWRLDRVFTQVSQRNSEKIFFFFSKCSCFALKQRCGRHFPPEPCCGNGVPWSAARAGSIPHSSWWRCLPNNSKCSATLEAQGT